MTITPNHQTLDANPENSTRIMTLFGLDFPKSVGMSGRHERIRTADLYRVKVAL